MKKSEYTSFAQRDHSHESRPAFTLIEVIVVVLILGVFVALFFPAVRSSGEAARRSVCKNNLKQIGIAFHNYYETHNFFPPAKTINKEGKELHSWRTLLLPYLEQGSLYEQINLNEPWSTAVNTDLADQQIPSYLCPSVDIPKQHTHYKAMLADDSFIRPDSCRALPENAAFSGSSILVTEDNPIDHVPWITPKDANLSTLLAIRQAEELAHKGVFQVVMTDGSVRAMNANISIDELKNLSRFNEEQSASSEKIDTIPEEVPSFDPDE